MIEYKKDDEEVEKPSERAVSTLYVSNAVCLYI